MSTFSQYNFKGQKALIRVDFNVPLDKKTLAITDDTRIKAAVPTIKKILGDGGSVILMSHLGRPKEGPEDKSSLKHLVSHISELLGTNVQFANDCIGKEAVDKAAALKPGEVLLLENLRFYKEEEKGDAGFAEKLSKLGDVYVNDAFGTAHRAHASTAVIAQFFPRDKKMFGLLMESEVKSAEKVMNNAEKPFVAIIGGAKVSDKILIIENLLERATDIIIGGGMAYTFEKAQGGKIGNSLCEDDRLDTARELLKKAEAKGVCLHFPSDSVIADKFDAAALTSNAPSNNIPDGWMGLDVGPNACDQFINVIKRSKTILWNGPMGVFEMEKFQHGTKCVATAVAEATQDGAFSLVGGGDSVAAVNQFGFSDQVSYVSTGGGAMLEFFEGKELPGIAAINK
ncbi:phosphoglycerate kinase [Niastella koreensis]|uniref:Phosphoglycerate kinase n=2 Tax=Niastella koreensis TaxID=354356 RepID=G8TB38_NIAKG|nr:phosphoglycerate kinase [Niastella koreensis]AEW01385.1 phosphoglycerate kinase [Niastella koreensis GR20-10]OQP48121.1 phosphoglycerate kinase [Niastella koreensis]